MSQYKVNQTNIQTHNTELLEILSEDMVENVLVKEVPPTTEAAYTGRHLKRIDHSYLLYS